MFTTEKQVVRLYVDKACSEHWIVKDQEGRFWMVRPGPDLGATPAIQADRGVRSRADPGHCKYMLGVPV